MNIARIISFSGLIGLILVVVTEGFYFKLNPGVFSVAIDPLVLVAWVLMMIALVASLNVPARRSETLAVWWQSSLAFIVDSSLIVSSLVIPFCLVVLVSENDGTIFLWEINREPGLQIDHIYSTVLMLTVLVAWAGIGLVLHPKITTPGALMMNVVLTTETDIPVWRLAIFGGFAYFGLFISFFTIFASDVRAIVWLRDS